MSRELIRTLIAVGVAVALPVAVTSTVLGSDAVSDAPDQSALVSDSGGINGSDQDRARELLDEGEIHSLRDIFSQVNVQTPGDLVGVALAQRQGHWVYTLKVLTATGKRVDVEVDAATMAIIATMNP